MVEDPNTLYAQRARRAARAVRRTSRFQAGADAGAGGLTGVPLCAPGLLPLLRAGARLRSRSRRIAEVVVVVVDRAVVDRGVVVQGLGGRARASGEVAVVRSCGPGLLPLLRAGARLRSRSRRVLEVVVFTVDRSGGVHELRCLSAPQHKLVRRPERRNLWS